MRAVLADGEQTVRDGLRALVTQGLGMQVVSEADTVAALQRQVRRHTPDLVIVAWNLVVAHAETALADLRRSPRQPRIVVVGLRPETRQAALAAGADGFISMVDAPDVVIRALQPSKKQGWSSDSSHTGRPAYADDSESNEPGGVS
jgi:DNA-binding NarL/FixJ family response regulator